MAAADRSAIASGTPGITLMESAGAAVAATIRDRWTPRPTVILCGPGNNGGDGFVVARHLDAAGWPVRLGLLGDRSALSGDAALAAAAWTGMVEPLAPLLLNGAALIVDALFGAGLSRPLEGAVREMVWAARTSRLPVVAVDVPSGLCGDSGAVLGDTVLPSDLTVTFFRPKPGHLLLPGRILCGSVVVADIGIPESVLAGLGPVVRHNGPGLWLSRWPWPAVDGHKYARGHGLILGGTVMTGAARLAARAAMRMGAGLVTIAADPAATLVYALAQASLIVQPVTDDAGIAALLADPRRNAVLLGPGAGADHRLRAAVLAALAAGKTGVLDADVFTAFAADPATLLDRLSPRWLLTPHDGECERLFGRLPGSRLDRARAAAAASGAVILLKGADTVIAHPDGRSAITDNAPPDLATAGSGDVLAGMAMGLITQGMDPFDAACAAAWVHGDVGREIGPGLIADDLAERIPIVLRGLKRAGAGQA
ncbi:MAG: hypothetical protein RLY86_4410 [Pseudomonadota bacterium]